MDDILEELTFSEVKELCKMYELHKQELPHLYSFLCCCVKAMENQITGYVHVYSPHNCWRKDGTFIASIPMHGHDIVLHSLDSSGRNLLEGFRFTNRFKCIKDPAISYTLLYAVHETFFEKLINIWQEAHECKFKLLNLWHLSKDDALKPSNISCPDDVYIKELDPSDVKVIKIHWPYTFPEADLKLLDYLKLGKGFGVYLKTTNQMVSWVAPSCLGQMTALQTLPDHTGKGYGTLVVKEMSKHLALCGFDSCATVESGNLASEAIFRKLGFKVLYQCGYVLIVNNK